MARKEIKTVARPGGLEAVYFDDGTREVRKAKTGKAASKPAEPKGQSEE